MEQQITAEEFVEWAAFYELEPWGFHADNWRMAVVAATTANYSGNVKKALKPSDFLPGPRKRSKRTMNAAELKTYLQRSIEDSRGE